MNEYEKDIMKLFDVHERAEKRELIKRINWEIEMGGISRRGKNEWVCKVTDSPMGTVLLRLLKVDIFNSHTF